MEKFSYEEYGYNIDDVNNFIEEVIENTQDIINSCLEQRKEIESLKNELSYYKQHGDINDIIANAKYDASIIVNDALIRNEELEDKNKKIISRLKVLKDKLEKSYNSQKELLEEIENVDEE